MIGYSKLYTELGIDTTKVRQAQLDNLIALDVMCDECMLMEDMQCGGVRTYLNVEETQYYKVPKMHRMACSRLLKKRQLQAIEDRLGASGIGATIPSTYVPIPVVITKEYIEYKEARIDIFSQWKSVKSLSPKRLVADAVYSGYNAKYFFTKRDLGDYWKLGEGTLFKEFLDVVDLLVVQGLFVHKGAEFLRDSFNDMIEERIDRNLPTIIMMNEVPVIRNGREKMLVEVISQWKEVPV